MKDREPIEIRPAANGFIVYPVTQSHEAVAHEAVFVFTTYEGLFAHLKTKFGLFSPAQPPE